jgi:hypothetical protein
VFYRWPVSKVSSDPHDPAGTVLRDTTIDGRADRPNAVHLVISIMVKTPIVERDDDSIVLVLRGHLNERRNEEAFHLRKMRSNTSAGRKIRHSRLATIDPVDVLRVGEDSTKSQPPERINFEVAARTLGDPGPPEEKARS